MNTAQYTFASRYVQYVLTVFFPDTLPKHEGMLWGFRTVST